MNINGLNIAANSSAFKSVSNAFIAPTQTATSTATADPQSDDTQASVSISDAGRAALATEVGAALRSSNAEKKQQAESADAEEPTSLIDEQIDRIKEQIKALQEMLTKLAGDNSKTAEQQRKLIQEQIMLLSNQIAVLMDKKMRDAQESAG